MNINDLKDALMRDDRHKVLRVFQSMLNTFEDKDIEIEKLNNIINNARHSIHDKKTIIEEQDVRLSALQTFADRIYSGQYRGAEARRVYKQMGLQHD